LVKDLEELERYPGWGHVLVVGKEEVRWQKSDEVLGYFSEKLRKARWGYRRFMLE
jgi:hypothetical protein